MNLITTTSDLADACKRLAAHDYVTVDTEFLRETTFWPKLCVIQLAGPDDAFIVDALATGLDLAPFFELMRDQSVIKVFHAARQDIEIVYHLGGLIPTPLFDTQVAAMVCGFGDSVSYDQLVQRITGARIDKSSRFTDWARRPLTQKQLEYALADVTYLRDVYLFLKANLAEQNRISWVGDEMQVLLSEGTYRTEPEDAWQRLKMRVRKPIELAVLMEVAAWREREAQSRDIPRSRILKDDVIAEIISQHPNSVERLGQLRSVPKGFERSRAGEQIVEAVKAGLARDPKTLPRIERDKPLSNGASATVELLKVLLRMTSEQHGVAAKVIATVDDLEQIAADEEPDVQALRGWRRELFGEKALALKSGRLALAMQRGRVIALDRPGE